MATDFYLKIDGIEGESTDEKHKGELEIESWGWSVTNAGTMGSGGGGGSGRASFSDMNISKYIDKSTPKLLSTATAGTHIKSMVLSCRKASGAGGQVDYLIITMEHVLIAGYTSGATADHPIPLETFALNYGKIKVDYKPQKDDGSLAGSVLAHYDRHTKSGG